FSIKANTSSELVHFSKQDIQLFSPSQTPFIFSKSGWYFLNNSLILFLAKFLAVGKGKLLIALFTLLSIKLFSGEFCELSELLLLLLFFSFCSFSFSSAPVSFKAFTK